MLNEAMLTSSRTHFSSDVMLVAKIEEAAVYIKAGMDSHKGQKVQIQMESFSYPLLSIFFTTTPNQVQDNGIHSVSD